MQNQVKISLIRHSLFWWVLGNFVGVVLALLLIVPSLNSLVTYGRLAPLHLNFQLYGWNSLPMLVLLYVLYEPKWPRCGIWFWTISLLSGGASWLLGHSSGKIFLEWQGIAKNIFLINLVFLWINLVFGFFYSSKLAKSYNKIKLFFILILGIIPFVFNFALSPNVFPPINTQSSGATGASLLISSLAVVAIFLLVPLVFEFKVKARFFNYLYFLLLHFVFWLFISHHNSSHHDLAQIIGLTSILVWIPLLIVYYKKFEIPSTPWLSSFAFWAILLVVDASITFLPGVLEFAKFTNLLVMHVHIAMAGMTTSFAMFILICLMPEADFLKSKFNFRLWNYSLLIHLLALFVVGLTEGHSFYYLLSEQSNSMFLLRLFTGLLMLLSSLHLFYKSIYEIKI